MNHDLNPDLLKVPMPELPYFEERYNLLPQYKKKVIDEFRESIDKNTRVINLGMIEER